MPTPPKLYLASTSPRRREILCTLGLDFEVIAVDIDESPTAGEAPDALVLRLAIAKVEAAPVAGLVLGADTVVVLDQHVLGKPRDADEAIDMLLALSGRTHAVLTGVALRSPEGTRTAVSATSVQFREIGRDEAMAYWQSGEPCDKAGAYAIQGMGAAFVAAIHGSYSGVVGLPVFETVELLKAVGIEILVMQK
jgi:nucleoside triphosphate pyrophosphatase